MSLIVFSHGNSFAGGTYSVLLEDLRARGHRVVAVDRFGHDPRYPVSSNWPHLMQQLADFAQEAIAQNPDQKVYLVGHSLGGFLSVMCAARHPKLGGQALAGVVMLDSPVLGGWRAKAVALAKGTRLVGAFSPGRVSRRRRTHWPDEAAALAHFSQKKAFSRWDPQVLRDYITHGTHSVQTEQGTQCALRFDRRIETAIYNTLPHNLDRLLRLHPLRCPVGFVGGTHSVEMRQVGLQMTRQLVGPHPQRLRMIEGSHLFPMEKPHPTAELLDAILRTM